MEILRTQDSQNHLPKEEQSWGTHTSQSKTYYKGEIGKLFYKGLDSKYVGLCGL